MTKVSNISNIKSADLNYCSTRRSSVLSLLPLVRVPCRGKLCRTCRRKPKELFGPGAQKLTGDNLKVVWAEFSTLSKAILGVHGEVWVKQHCYSPRVSADFL